MPICCIEKMFLVPMKIGVCINKLSMFMIFSWKHYFFLLDFKPILSNLMQECSKKSFLRKGTLDYGLWYKKDNNLFINVYTNVDLVVSVDDQRGTSGSVFFLGDILVSWFSKK